MQKVIGIGGIFFRAKDPDALNHWYEKNLGVQFPEWRQEAGSTAFSAFAVTDENKNEENYYNPSRQPFMINFRVNNIDAMIKQLRDAGATVREDIEDSPYGRFSWVIDPEGNKVELWEPKDNE
jgi:predicted enzyme related to lactoylglutathione lyase